MSGDTNDEILTSVRLIHRPDWGAMCRGCGVVDNEYIQPWPCETAELFLESCPACGHSECSPETGCLSCAQPTPPTATTGAPAAATSPRTGAMGANGAECDCPPCPGRGNDGHKMTHCAECCFGSGVEADIDCPVHGAA